MNMPFIFQQIETILLFAVIALATNWIGASRGFFRLKTESAEPIPILFRQVIIVFLIYIGTLMWLGRYFAMMIRGIIPHLGLASPVAAVGIFQLTLTLIALALLLLYLRTLPREPLLRVWKDKRKKQISSISTDLLIGASTWFMSFPIVVLLGQLCDLILYLLFGVVNYEQVAVRYLKTTVGSPFMVVLALLLILVAAPVIEEFLFRGMLQSWLKKHLGIFPAIFCSALLFGAFHLSASQGLGNISLVVPLFAFGCYLGFVYERQGSLYASIALHATFNTISSYQILIAPETL